MSATKKNIVYKKVSRDKSIAAYLSKRDFVDHGSHTDPVDGVLLVDTGYIKEQKVYCRLSCIFHYGPEDIGMIGQAFNRDLYVSTVQVYPPTGEQAKPLTKAQERLIRKIGDKALPFCFEFPNHLPCSVCLQPSPNEPDKLCYVEFKVVTFCVNNLEEKIRKRSSVQLTIRKVQYAPDQTGPKPTGHISKHFLMSDQPLHLTASLNKEIYYHGEPISVDIEVNNNSNKCVKSVKVSVIQATNVVLYSNDRYVEEVAVEEADDQIASGSNFSKTYVLLPLMADNSNKHGIALDGRIKQEDTNLASSTILKEGADRDVQGMLVSYVVRTSLLVPGMLGDLTASDVTVEVPFLLMHPSPEMTKKPEEDDFVVEDDADVSPVDAEDDE
ncbi:S-arrestin-like [Scyliorhinus canicula]|uniref:S-arrestin-like n=1 Tax=Scyliorhinus canicula TaxID=7830 RepID=UPI0018F436DE|nr:S-arrestin-like [Scyliorhinus canicula]XP_038673499.1 S-arrestin-like [Scyliorhinus canicula]